MENQKTIKIQKLIIIILAVVSVILLGLCIYFATSKGSEKCASTNSGSTNTNNNQESTNNYTNEETNNNVSSSGNYKLGDTLVFGGLELTFDTTYTFTKVDNRYSEKNGQSVIKLGVTVKNVSSEKNHLNMFYYDLFGSQGIELDSISSYFDDDIDSAGDLKPGASYKAYFYILYDGDGKYSIDFDNFNDKVSIEFDIKK